MIDVRMTWREVSLAARSGLSRCLNNLKDGRKDANGASGFGADLHVMGAIGEAAVAQHFGLPWEPMAFGRIDVGSFEVRATYYHAGRLVLHHTDRDDVPFILARLHRLPVVVLVGWMPGFEAKREEWWGECNPDKPNHRPAFWVPNDELFPIEELPP